MDFVNLNFKLVVLEQLLKLGYFKEEWKAVTGKFHDPDNYDYEPIAGIYDFCKAVKLTEEQLAQVTFITFDGGLDIYHELIPNWDGEDEQFDVDDLSDITKLSGLQKISVISMLTADAAPMLQLDTLKAVSWYELDKDENMAGQLRAKGVTVTP